MASLVVGGVFLLAMIVVSTRAAVTLPAGARIAIHCGSVEHCYLAPKRAGLMAWPALGAAAFGLLGGIAASSLAAGWVPGVRDVLVPAVLAVLLAFQAGALALARRGFAGVGEAPGGVGEAPGGEGAAPGGVGEAPGGEGAAPGGPDGGRGRETPVRSD